MLRSLGNRIKGCVTRAAALAVLVGFAFEGKPLNAQSPTLRAPSSPIAGLPSPSGPGQSVPTPAPLITDFSATAAPTTRPQWIDAGSDLEKPLPMQIESMPGATEKLDVIHRRSQLVVTRQRVMRFAIADPSVIDIVQYSPNELSIVGLELGSTNLLYWFEGQVEPLIYEVTVVPDPALEEQRRIDYGRLERKLAILFPNSKVYLIPLSGKIVVKV